MSRRQGARSNSDQPRERRGGKEKRSSIRGEAIPQPVRLPFDSEAFQRALERARHFLDHSDMPAATRELKHAREQLAVRDERDPKRAELERRLQAIEAQAKAQRRPLFEVRERVQSFKIDAQDCLEVRFHRFVPIQTTLLLRQQKGLREAVETLPESYRDELHASIDETARTLRGSRWGSLFRLGGLAVAVVLVFVAISWIPRSFEAARFTEEMAAARLSLEQGNYEAARAKVAGLKSPLEPNQQREVDQLTEAIDAAVDLADFEKADAESAALTLDGEFARARRAFNGYLGRDGGAAHEDRVTARIEEIEIEWDKANYEGSRQRVADLLAANEFAAARDVWQAYLDGEPTPRHSEVVTKSITAITSHWDDSLYAHAAQLATAAATNHDFESALVALETYLEHPGGQHQAQATHLITQLTQSWDRLDWETAERVAGPAESAGDLTRAANAWRAYLERTRRGSRHEEVARNVRNLDLGLHTWSYAIRSIAQTCPKYGGRTIAAQVGLEPWRLDASTGLWEFLALDTGAVPPSGYPGEDSAVIFVLLPGGTARLGAQRSEADGHHYDIHARENEGPVREVELEGFFLAKHELTQAQAARLLGTNPSRFTPGQTIGDRNITPLHPAESLSWIQCRDLAAQHGWEIPSEDQWEYAARAGTDTPWWTGEDASSLRGKACFLEPRKFDYAALQLPYLAGATNPLIGKALPADSWASDGYPVHAPIGQFAANAFGLHDLLGNVHEWCFDQQGTSGDAITRGIRGGDFLEPGYGLRVTRRCWAVESAKTPRVGFRPARTVD